MTIPFIMTGVCIKQEQTILLVEQKYDCKLIIYFRVHSVSNLLTFEFFQLLLS